MENWLIIGSGGREYMMAQTLAKQQGRLVYVAPGNPMMDQIDHVQTVEIDELDFEQLANFAVEKQVICTVVGPEQPLSKGISDYFNDRGLLIFGPSQNAARLESSKTFAKQMMATAKVPTASFETFNNQADALAYVANQQLPLVIKADGLAAGKGVIIAKSQDEANDAVKKLYSDGQTNLLIEEYLIGEEFSLFAMAHGTQFVTMPIAQDHKRLNDGDNGPNTGGMGAYSPVPHITNDLKQDAINHVIKPILAAMEEDGVSFTGFLYAGLIKTQNGIRVIEFNVRMGDPETQVVLPQLKSDLGRAILELKRGVMPSMDWQKGDYYLGAVVASRDYPRDVVNGRPLPKLDAQDVLVSYAGVARENKQLVSHGGRVLMVTVQNTSLIKAQQRVNQILDEQVDAQAYTFRHDIGFHVISDV